jgi:hypothetical protein
MKHLGWLLVPLALTCCRTRDVDLLAQIFQRIGEKIEANVRHSSTRASPFGLPGLTPEPIRRVRCRLQWDRFLDGVQVEIDSPAEGVVRLRGTVASNLHRQRLTDLARETIGVREVKDELVVSESQ